MRFVPIGLIIAFCVFIVWFPAFTAPKLAAKEGPQRLAANSGTIAISRGMKAYYFIGGLFLVSMSIGFHFVNDANWASIVTTIIVALTGWKSLSIWLPAYSITWDESGIEGFRGMLPYPIGPKRIRIAWAEITYQDLQPKHPLRGLFEYRIRGKSRDMIEWSNRYAGSDVLVAHIKKMRPDLFEGQRD